MLEQILQASKVGVPILGISTADQRDTISKITLKLSQESGKPFTAITWNCLDGCAPSQLCVDDIELPKAMVEKTEQSLKLIRPPAPAVPTPFDTPNNTVLPDLEAMLVSIRTNLDERSIVFVQNAHLFMQSSGVLQAIWNLRQAFKSNRRLLVLLSSEFKSPSELKDDIVVFDDPLPGEKEIKEIITTVETSIKKTFEAKTVEKCADALLGLSAFSAEQTLFLALKKNGNEITLDIDQLKHVKRTLIKQTPGLRITENQGNFQDIGGVENIKRYMSGIIKGRKPPKLIVFIDEIEKAMAGSTGGDNTGVSQDILGQMLQFMENTHARGIIFVGPPGTSKTLVAKGFGGEAGVDTVEFDLGAVKQAEVGNSEKNIRQALKVINSCSRGSSYWIATSNNLSVIPPELRRRFTDGVFFFDLPTQEERNKIWDIQIKLNNLTAKQVKDRPLDHQWTGAEIRNCCSMAYDRNVTLKEASEFINPVAVSSSQLIQRLREEASGKFLNASKSGHYQLSTKTEETNQRQISL